VSGRLFVLIAGTLFSWLCAACTLHFFWYFFRKSEIFAHTLRRPTLQYGYFALASIGVGYGIFCGVESMLQWMPKGWVTGEDDPISVKYSVAGTVAFFLTLAFMGEMEKLVERLRMGEHNLALLKQRSDPPP
jgi:hypothetical protein